VTLQYSLSKAKRLCILHIVDRMECCDENPCVVPTIIVQEPQAGDGSIKQPNITTTSLLVVDERGRNSSGIASGLDDFLAGLEHYGIKASVPHGRSLPPEAMMHDRAAVVPTIVVSPRSEWGVIETLRLLSSLRLYNQHAVSVRSGGHGYHNGGSCSGIMINLGSMANRRIVDDILHVEPGCMLGQLIGPLANHEKAVPHGDCFGVGAGGHFLTAGWDIALARRYGLGCQSVIGGRIVLWDGSVVDVNEKNHPELLYAMRGGAAAGVGVVTEIRLRLIDQPPRVSCHFQSLSRTQLEIFVAHHAFGSAANLPKDISMSFRFHFESDQPDPVCSLNVVSLLPVEETVECLRDHLGGTVASIIAGRSGWQEKSLKELRMLPASKALAANPQMLEEATPEALHESPLTYWKPTLALREMARSYFTSVSHWVVSECDIFFLELYKAFYSVREKPARARMYALVIQGGGRMTELQHQCSMPLGQALARFEMHWDDPVDEQWSREFTDKISRIMKSKSDSGPSRPYRGDIWLEEQGQDAALDAVLDRYDRRSAV
jgi:hypothetical protein